MLYDLKNLVNLPILFIKATTATILCYSVQAAVPFYYGFDIFACVKNINVASPSEGLLFALSPEKPTPC